MFKNEPSHNAFSNRNHRYNLNNNGFEIQIMPEGAKNIALSKRKFCIEMVAGDGAYATLEVLRLTVEQ